MRVHTGPVSSWPQPSSSASVAMGTFDGVHLGHAAVIRRAGDVAAQRSLELVVATFDPHPMTIVAPERAPQLLTTVEQRMEQFEALGAAAAAAIPFDETLRHRTPRQFAQDVLVDGLRASFVAVGADFRFGFGREGDASGLAAIGSQSGFDAEAVPLLGDRGPVSSTRIREMLRSGDVRGAAALLGRPYALRGTVVGGEGRGEGIGVPTANLELADDLVVPGHGVYAIEAEIEAGVFGGAANVGVRPTFGGDAEVVEAHLFDFEGDLYGRPLDLRFVHRLREERRFDSIDELVTQIRRDLVAAAEALSAR